MPTYTLTNVQFRDFHRTCPHIAFGILPSYHRKHGSEKQKKPTLVTKKHHPITKKNFDRWCRRGHKKVPRFGDCTKQQRRLVRQGKEI